MVLIVKGSKQNCLLVDNIVDVHIYNNKRLMINFTENPTKVGGSTLDDISSGREKVKIRLTLKDRIKKLVLTLTNIFYFPHSSSNLISLELLNDVGIYHHNEDQILYNLEMQKTLVFAE